MAVYGTDRDTFIGKASELLEVIRVERDDIKSRLILFLGHSMGGLLIKQASINAHNNPKYTPIKDATTGLAFFATPHHGGDWMLNSGLHQLEKYDIISFWGALDKIVPAKSARFGMPGNRENVVKLIADHSEVCKFGPSLEDQDNFKLVRGNIKDLYKKALGSGQQLKRHQESDSSSSKPKRARIANRTDITHSDNESYDDDNDDEGDSANGEGLDREVYGGNSGSGLEVVHTDVEDGGDEEDDSAEDSEEDDSGEADSSEEDSFDED
ncbi:hypothetical protein DL98DRAFT_539475 [Cadophora sp. DSE1049]|nr:hypothetical protein DL98DRAFT_539475 [Cadophora sp. DSE1049]